MPLNIKKELMTLKSYQILLHSLCHFSHESSQIDEECTESQGSISLISRQKYLQFNSMHLINNRRMNTLLVYPTIIG